MKLMDDPKIYGRVLPLDHQVTIISYWYILSTGLPGNYCLEIACLLKAERFSETCTVHAGKCR